MLKSILTNFLATLGSKSIFAAYSLDRDPTYDDFIDVQTLIQTMIDDSTCPDPEVVINHWDSDGIEGGDCVLFPRSEGNRPLLPRLVRLSFHDAAGNLLLSFLMISMIMMFFLNLTILSRMSFQKLIFMLGQVKFQ